MRRNSLSVLPLAVVLTIVSASGAAVAFHGAAYYAEGTAEKDGETYTAKVLWSGGAVGGPAGVGAGVECPASGGFYKVEIRDQDTHQPVAADVFPGCEIFNDIQFNGCIENVTDYRGRHLVTTDIFFIWGWQANDLCNGTAEMHYWGHYMDYDLNLKVWGAVGPNAYIEDVDDCVDEDRCPEV